MTSWQWSDFKNMVHKTSKP